jgi:hypothetical protein
LLHRFYYSKDVDPYIIAPLLPFIPPSPSGVGGGAGAGEGGACAGAGAGAGARFGALFLTGFLATFFLAAFFAAFFTTFLAAFFLAAFFGFAFPFLAAFLAFFFAIANRFVVVIGISCAYSLGIVNDAKVNQVSHSRYKKNKNFWTVFRLPFQLEGSPSPIWHSKG